MVKVITYGTFDILHYGHIRLLERAKALGDYLVVGVTSDDFDKTRGKINVKQSLSERIDAVRATGLADEIIVEEYEGQKIDDIRRYDIDIFTVGSDWKGKFDYLNEFCKVVYLDRTKGVSSSQIRTVERNIRLGVLGDYITVIDKFIKECELANGVELSAVCIPQKDLTSEQFGWLKYAVDDYETMLDDVDAVYIVVHPDEHDYYVRTALEHGKHVLCESPISTDSCACRELFELAKEKQCVLMESLKTAYSLAYKRLLLLLKTGIIGEIASVDATCTSLKKEAAFDYSGLKQWGSMYSWASFGLLPVFDILGCDYISKSIQAKMLDNDENYDLFAKINLVFKGAVASVKVGNGVKSEGELVISGSKGYVYVPAPWWKTDYFEVRFENPQDNKRYFYQLEGEGIRYMIVSFIKSVAESKNNSYISQEMSEEISKIYDDFKNRVDTVLL